jgi:hypothetical protein
VGQPVGILFCEILDALIVGVAELLEVVSLALRSLRLAGQFGVVGFLFPLCFLFLRFRNVVRHSCRLVAGGNRRRRIFRIRRRALLLQWVRQGWRLRWAIQDGRPASFGFLPDGIRCADGLLDLLHPFGR